jgi:hypothetical protein
MIMDKDQLEQYLRRLGLAPADAAQLLSISPRTLRRWLDGEEIPGPAQRAILAWIHLHELHLPWRPDAVSIVGDDQDQIARHRQHTIDLDEVLQRVEARGGAKAPWVVDWDKGRASLASMEVSFYKLQSGGFSLGSYRRTDSAPDATRDMPMIEDAVYCVAQTLAKKAKDNVPVTLVLHDGPAKGRVAKQQFMQFPNAKAGIKHLCKHMGQPGYHEPFLMTRDSELLWDQHELKRECIRRADGPKALADLAAYVRQHSNIFVQDGPGSVGPAERTRRETRIKALGDSIAELAQRADDGSVHYQDFEEFLGLLHAAGFFPPNGLVGDVAFALEGVRR